MPKYIATADEITNRKKIAYSILEKKPGMRSRLSGLGLSIDAVAYIVACALIGKERHRSIIDSSENAKADLKSARQKLLSEIKKLETMLDNPNGEISARAVFFDQHKARPLLAAEINKTLCGEKKQRELGKGKPKLKYFDTYCSAFRALFAQLGKSPNSRLIADIANIFNLSDRRQTSETIRTRLKRLP
jgi:hypothetical protein